MEEMTRGSKAFFSSATHLGLMATPKSHAAWAKSEFKCYEIKKFYKTNL